MCAPSRSKRLSTKRGAGKRKAQREVCDANTGKVSKKSRNSSLAWLTV